LKKDSKRCLYMNVHNSIIHNTPKGVNNSNNPNSAQMEKLIVIYIDSVVLFDHNKGMKY
jgi:hypothetical protein